MEPDKGMTEILKQEFSALNETDKKDVIEMTKFLVLAQNKIIPAFLSEHGFAYDRKSKNRRQRRNTNEQFTL
jgi:hypothetical protein